MSNSEDLTGSWTSPSCTLPTAERPLRLAEFDELFAHVVGAVEQREPGRVRLRLEPTPELAARAANLVVRETACCSFFTFTLTATGGELHLDVSVPDGHLDVLDAVGARAEATGTPA